MPLTHLRPSTAKIGQMIPLILGVSGLVAHLQPRYNQRQNGCKKLGFE